MKMPINIGKDHQPHMPLWNFKLKQQDISTHLLELLKS